VIPNCLANCAVFKVRRGARRGDSAAWSLKTQQRVCGTRDAKASRARALRPGPVDIPKAAGAIKQTGGA
jgi:hypothetical protein